MTDWGVHARRVAITHPVPVEPEGRGGPTKRQATGPKWRRSSAGLYVPAEVDRSVVEQRIVEEAARLPPGGAVTGWAALRLHGVGYLDGLGADGRTELRVPLVVPPAVRVRPTPTISVHSERLEGDDLTTRYGVPVTVPARAAFDAARRAPDLRSAVVAIDMTLAARVVTRADLTVDLAGRTGWRGLRQAQRALSLADPRSMSPRETLLRLVWCLDAGLPTPRSNWPVADEYGVVVGRPDLLSVELGVVGEFDGAEHRSRGRHRDDLRRDDAFRDVGLEPFRVVGADLDDVPLVLRRICRAVERAQGLRRSFLVRAQA